MRASDEPGAAPGGGAATLKGEVRRRQIVEAAAALVREGGPSSVSHRAVARRAACSLSATTYYFEGLEDLLHQAGALNISLWASRAERVAERVESRAAEDVAMAERVEAILSATLPSDQALIGHYAQLISAGDFAPVARAYRTGRSRLNAAVARVLAHLRIDLTADLAIAVVDGAAVSALSEGRDVKATARELLESVCRRS